MLAAKSIKFRVRRVQTADAGCKSDPLGIVVCGKMCITCMSQQQDKEWKKYTDENGIVKVTFGMSKNIYTL